MDIDYNALQFWLSLANTVGLVAIGIYTWWANRNKATAEAIAAARAAAESQIAALTQRLSGNEVRLLNVEHEVRDRLRSEDLHDLYNRINEINREMGEFSANLRAANEQLRLHQEFLLHQGHG